jgi:ATP-dependent helicase/nuclease subunit B
MAVIERMPLFACGNGVWHAFADRVTQWASTGGVALRDAIVLVPFAALLAPARAGFSRRGGWQPRIETTQTLASSLGPAAAWQSPQLSFDMATDRLQAARLLRDQPMGRALARADPRRFDRVVGAVVETAHALARAARCRAPTRRGAYWTDARALLTHTTGPGARQRWLARIALEWAATGPEPATDRLYCAHPAAWVSFQAGGVDPLVEALFDAAADATRCLVVDADAEVGGWPTKREAPALARCDDLEHEAQSSAAQVLWHLERGEWPVALASVDRQLVRRVRALLDRQNVSIADETGWRLSTTRAAASVMALLRAAVPKARTDSLFDWLKGCPPWPDLPRGDWHLSELERACRQQAISQGDRVMAMDLDPGLRNYVERIEGALAGLRADERAIGQWLSALRDALRACGSWDALASDDAGRAVLRALHLDVEGARPPAWCQATASVALGLDGFTAWVDAALADANYTPPVPSADAVRVVITPLARVMCRPIAALVCTGVDDRHLGALPSELPLLSDADRVALGLGGRAEHQRRDGLAFAHALALPRVTLMRHLTDASGEPRADSPLLQRLALDLAQQGRAMSAWQDPRTTRRLLPRPLARPLPRAPDALPPRVSASAVEALRDCPYRFFARHVLGLREDGELDTELDKRDYGEWLHRVLLAFHRRRADAADPDEDLDLLQRVAQQQQTALGIGDDEFLPFAASFARVAPVYLAWLHARDREGIRWLDGEREIRRQPEPLAGIELQGVIDRIDSDGPGGALELIDYKTSAIQRLKDKVKRPLEDTQLAFYAALLAPEVRGPLRACYLPLDQADGIKPVAHQQVLHSADMLVRELGDEFRRLREGAPMPALGEGEVCDNCEVRGLCRRDHWPDGAGA